MPTPVPLEQLAVGDAVLVTFTDTSILRKPNTLALHVTDVRTDLRPGPVVTVGYDRGRWGVSVDQPLLDGGSIIIERG